jgi:ParB family chromosome partitioning protein
MAEGKKLRLGRGLEHLIAKGMVASEDDGGASEEQSFSGLCNELRELPMACLIPNAKQARRQFNAVAMRELADSIAAEGLLQPIIVRSAVDGRFSIVAGERRFRAMQMLGKSTVMAKIIDADESDCAIISLIENLQRESLNPVEEAEGFLRLVDEFGLTQEQIAQKVGKARATVANALRDRKSVV